MFTGLQLLYFKFFPPKTDPEIRDILNVHSSYFQNLEEAEKERFISRVVLFQKFVRFRSASRYSISKSMKIIIASAAIQLTFGLKRFIFRYYKNILVFPGQYKIPEYSENLLGHVDKQRRTISMSWPSITFGFEVPDDAHNVALHEMAHVILFENTLRLSFNEFFSRVNWDLWLEVAGRRFIWLQTNRSPVLKPYAARNLMEMFAVSVETFFEKPEQFQKHLPQLYAAMSRLLMQNPLNEKKPTVY